MMAVRNAVHSVDNFVCISTRRRRWETSWRSSRTCTGGTQTSGIRLAANKPGQDQSIALVSLGTSFGDLLDPDRVGDLDFSNQRSQQVVHMPGVGRGFDDYLVFGKQVTGGPIRQLLIGDLARLQSALAFSVHCGNHGIMFVDIEGDVTGT